MANVRMWACKMVISLCFEFQENTFVFILYSFILFVTLYQKIK